MGIFSRSKPIVTKGEYNGFRWPDTGVSDALVRTAETLKRQYARDPVAQRLVDAAVGEAYTYARRNARFLSSQTCRLYRKGSTPRRGERSVKDAKRAVLVKRWGTKVGDILDTGDAVEVTNHQILNFLASPHPFWPGTELEEAKFFFKQIAGNHYETFSKVSGGQMIAWPMFPQYVTVQADENSLVKRYFFGRNESRMVELDPDQVIHYRNGIDKNNPLMGASDIAHILPEIDLINRVTMFDLSFVINGNRPDHLFVVKDDTTPEQIKALGDRLYEWFRSRSKSGLPFIARGIDPKPLTVPPKDLRTPEQLALYAARIRRALGWTESMADSNDSTYAGAKVADGQYGQYIMDKLSEDASQKTNFLCPMFGLDPDEYQFVYDSPISEDAEAEERRFIALSSGAVLTPNEVREALGYDKAADENADRLWFNGMPLGGAAPADPFAGLFGGGGNIRDIRSDAGAAGNAAEGGTETPPPAPQNESEAGKSLKDQPIQSQTLDLWAEIKGLEAPQWREDAACACCGMGTKDDDFFANNPLLRELARRFFNPLRETAFDILTDAQAAAIEAWASDTNPNLSLFAEQAVSELAKVLTPLAEEAIKEAMVAGANARGITLADDVFSVVPERAVAFIENYTPRLAGELMDTTAEMARRAVERGLQEGLSQREVAKLIEGVPAYRAEAIARTELNRAASEGLVAGWKEVGIAKAQWINGAAPRASHAEIAKKPVRSFDEPWVKARETLAGETFDRDIFMPPAGVNCQCSLLPIVNEEDLPVVNEEEDDQ